MSRETVAIPAPTHSTLPPRSSAGPHPANRLNLRLTFLRRPASVLVLAFAAISARGQNLSLHDAIQQAQASPQAREAQDRIDAVHGLVIQAGLRPNPRLFLQSEDLRPWADNFDFPTATEDYGYLSQTIELGGKRSSRLGVARANLRQAEAERALLLQEIAGRVAAAYWSAVVSQGIATLLEADMAAVDAIVRYNQARVDAGATRGVDLLRVQIERDRLHLAFAAARRDTLLTRIDLFRQMGRSAPTSASTLHLSDSIDAITPIPRTSIDAVLAARADVAVAREAVAVATAEVKLQHAVGVPDLDLLGGYKRNITTNTLYTGLQIPLPFSNRNQGEIERARASVHIAEDRLHILDLTVRADVDAAEGAFAQQQQVIQTVLPDMRARAKQNLAIMDDAYRTGGVDLLRFLDAERTEFDIEVSALRSLADFQQAGLRLQLAYGARP
jgi:cobalt-zinc-cadmium efflux system outer membrane protein